MTFHPEPWDSGKDDTEIAEEMSAMGALDPPYEPDGKSYTALFRHFWERLLRGKSRS